MKIKKSDIKKGFRFYWLADCPEFCGLYEIVCFNKRLSPIFCYKPIGKESTFKREGQLAKFDERIINNNHFEAYKKI